jgi:predicted RecB family nuclease
MTTRVEVDRRGRFYELPGGERFPSVTNILGVIGKPALINWAASQEREMVIRAAASLYEDLPTNAQKMTRIGFVTSLQTRLGKEKAHQKALSKASEIGSQVHALIEWNLRKELGHKVTEEQAQISPKAAWAFQAYEKWRAEVGFKPVMIEQTVWSKTHGYAGTMDFLADVTLNGERVLALGDWKSGKAIYEEALLQNAAYVAALTEMGHAEPGHVWGVIVRLPKIESDPDFEARIISPAEQAENFEAFLSAKRTWEWVQKHNRWMRESAQDVA